MSTRGGFILEINKLEDKRKTTQTKQAPAKQRAAKRAKKNKQHKCNQRNTSKAKSNQESNKKQTNKCNIMQPKKHKQNTEGSLEGPGRVSTGQGSFLVLGQVSHFWLLFFRCRVKCRTFGRFLFLRRKSRTFGSLLFRFIFASFAEKRLKKSEKKRPKVRLFTQRWKKNMETRKQPKVPRKWTLPQKCARKWTLHQKRARKRARTWTLPKSAPESPAELFNFCWGRSSAALLAGSL